VAFQHSPQQVLVGSSCRRSRRRKAAIALGADIEFRRAALPEAQHVQTQYAAAFLEVENPAYDVTLFRPEMKDALTMFGGNRIVGAAKIEQGGAIFDDYSIGVCCKKGLDRADEGVWLHIQL
jgi:hypothetical protein